MQISDIISPKKNISRDMLITPRNGNGNKHKEVTIQKKTDDGDSTWVVLGVGGKYEYKSSTWATKRYDRMLSVVVKNRDDIR
jgi:hypothetical protein